MSDTGNKINDIEWDLPSCFLIAGKPKKGKSHFIKWFLYDNMLGDTPDSKKFKYGIVMANHASIGEYNFLPRNVLFEGYNEYSLKFYINGLVERNNSLNEVAGNNGNIKVLIEPNFVILDDLVGLLSSNSEWFISFVTTFRKTNTTIIIATQYLNKNISPTIRECINYAILFNTKTARSLKAMFDAFGGLFESFVQFKEHFFNITKKTDTMFFPAMLYYELEEDISMNYLQIEAPKDLPTVNIKFDMKVKSNDKSNDDDNKSLTIDDYKPQQETSNEFQSPFDRYLPHLNPSNNRSINQHQHQSTNQKSNSNELNSKLDTIIDKRYD